MTRSHARKSPVCPGTSLRAWIVPFVTTIFLLTISSRSFALEPLPQPGKAKITTGAGLMFVGAATIGIGSFIYVANQNSGKSDCTPCQQKAWIMPTVLWSVGGAVLLGGGVVLTLGLVEKSRAYAPTVSLNVSPFGASARLQF